MKKQLKRKEKKKQLKKTTKKKNIFNEIKHVFSFYLFFH